MPNKVACQRNLSLAESWTSLQGNPLQTFCQNQKYEENCLSPQCTYSQSIKSCSYNYRSCEDSIEFYVDKLCTSCYSRTQFNNQPCDKQKEQNCLNIIGYLFSNQKCSGNCNQLSLEAFQANSKPDGD